jgi:hypothetical protein
MARPTLATHPKFFRLAALVGGRAVARGALELIWDAAYASGNPMVGDSISVEATADWRGERGVLADALVSSGFLDVVQPDASGGQMQTFAVHDLEDHAPDYVLKRWDRERKRKEAGETIRSVRQAAAKRRWLNANGIQVNAGDGRLQTDVDHLSAVVLPPAPAPAPLIPPSARTRDPRAPVPPALPGSAALAPPRPPQRPYPPGAATLHFLAVFDRYPRKDKKLEAAAVWQELAEEHPGGELGLRDEILAWFETGALKRHPYAGENRFRPLLESVLAERRWLDPPSDPDNEEKRSPPARSPKRTDRWDGESLGYCQPHGSGRLPRKQKSTDPRESCPPCQEFKAWHANRESEPESTGDVLAQMAGGRR